MERKLRRINLRKKSYRKVITFLWKFHLIFICNAEKNYLILLSPSNKILFQLQVIESNIKELILRHHFYQDFRQIFKMKNLLPTMDLMSYEIQLDCLRGNIIKATNIKS